MDIRSAGDRLSPAAIFLRKGMGQILKHDFFAIRKQNADDAPDNATKKTAATYGKIPAEALDKKYEMIFYVMLIEMQMPL